MTVKIIYVSEHQQNDFPGSILQTLSLKHEAITRTRINAWKVFKSLQERKESRECILQHLQNLDILG